MYWCQLYVAFIPSSFVCLPLYDWCACELFYSLLLTYSLNVKKSCKILQRLPY